MYLFPRCAVPKPYESPEQFPDSDEFILHRTGITDFQAAPAISARL